MCVCVCVCRYVNEGGEAGLRQLNARIDDIKQEVGEKTDTKRGLEERVKQLQKEVANVEVSISFDSEVYSV